VLDRLFEEGVSVPGGHAEADGEAS
jgi:hypothetical protein